MFLQRLATDEIGPSADLGGNALGARELLTHALSEEDSGLISYKVEASADVVLLEDLSESSLVLLGELNNFDLDLGLGLSFDELLDLGASSVQLVAERGNVVDNLCQPGLRDVTTKEKTLARLGHAEVHCGLERSPVGLNEVFTEASDLTSGRHLNTQERIGASKTGPGELGDLGRNVVALHGHEISGRGDVLTNKGLGSSIDEVGSEDLADKGERSRSTKIALDNLEERLTTLRVLGLDDLHVEGTADLPGLGDLLSDFLDTLHGSAVEVGGRKDEGGITRVDTSLLDVLGNSVQDKLSVGRDTVNVDFLSSFNKLGDNHGVVRRDVAGSLELNVRWANQDGVANLLGKFLSILYRSKLLPSRLVDTDTIENLGELLTVLSLVNIPRIRSENIGTSKLVCFIVICAHRLRIKIDHNCLLSHLSKSPGSTDSTPIELNGATDSVNTTAKDNSTIVLEGDIVSRAIVGGVEVVGVGREFGGKGVNLLNPGVDSKAETVGTNLVFGTLDGVGNLSVGETHLLGLENLIFLQALEATSLLKLASAVNNVLQLVKEPLVDLGQLMDLVNGVVLVEHGLADSEPSTVGRVLELKVKILKLVALESNESRVDLTDSLLERLLKGSADSHNFTNRLHGTANVALDVLELGKIPSRNLGDDVVKRRLEVGGSGLGNSVGKLGQGVTETDLSSSVSKRISSSLGGQSRGSRKTSVDLNDTVVKTIGLESVLDVTLANNTKMSDNLDGSTSEHVVLLVTQGLTGGNNDGVTGVNTKRVKVLHVAHGDTVVVGVTNDLVLKFLPALERLLDKDLRREGERSSGHVAELLLVVGETGTKTAESISSSDNDGVSDSLGGLEGLLNSANSNRLGDGDVNLFQSPSEEVTIFTQLQSSNAGTEDLDAVLLEKSESLHLNTKVESSLTTKGQEDTIRLLLLDDVRNILGGDREVIDLISQTVVGLDGSDVGVDEHRSNAGFLESLEGLSACDLSILSNGKTTTSNDKNLLDIDGLRRLDNSTVEVGPGVRSVLSNGAVSAHNLEGAQALRVGRSSGSH
ncbi:hypothetical protein HG531_013452 [Fusarium graminearum]|nr:hypothetical protein HG531_013452 [Fusarium graminearum]